MFAPAGDPVAPRGRRVEERRPRAALMNNFASLFWTSVGRKLFTGLTGLLLVGFVIGHLAGNMTLFMGNQAVNEYAFFLEDFLHGMALPFAEIGLILMFGVHIVSALSATKQNRTGRSQGYAVVRDAGGRSHKTASSKTMAVTGIVLMLFVVLHVLQFKFGIFVGRPDDYLYSPGPDSTHKVRDLYRIVVETFKNPLWVGLYTAVMIGLGFHLRHGIWSAFQTLGLISPRLRAFLVPAAVVLAILLAVGFIMLPVYLFLAPTPQFMTGGAPQ